MLNANNELNMMDLLQQIDAATRLNEQNQVENLRFAIMYWPHTLTSTYLSSSNFCWTIAHVRAECVLTVQNNTGMMIVYCVFFNCAHLMLHFVFSHSPFSPLSVSISLRSSLSIFWAHSSPVCVIHMQLTWYNFNWSNDEEKEPKRKKRNEKKIQNWLMRKINPTMSKWFAVTMTAQNKHVQ